MSTRSEPAPPPSALTSAFAASLSPMVLTDARASDNPISWANAAFLSLTGYDLGELQGRNCRMLQGADTDRAEADRIREALSEGRTITAELLNYRKDGTPFWNAMTITPVRDDGGIAYFYAAQVDTTPMHTLEQAMRGAHDELEPGRRADRRSQRGP